MTTINTNVMSMNAQRNLTASQGSLATSMQRLSSGLRVNSAKDDAAGLAIAERLSAQVKGLNVAARNANDGISLAQTAEGALGKVSDMLQRVRELAVQGANATNSDGDRVALDSEAQQLKAEIDRIANQTRFNGSNLLNGNFIGKTFQVGANAGELISFPSLKSLRMSDMPGVDGYRVVAPPGTTVGTSLPLSIDVSTLTFDQNAATERLAQDSFMQAVSQAFDAAAVSSSTYDPSTGNLTVRNDSWASLIVGLDNIGGTSANLGVGQTLVLNVSNLSLSTATTFNPLDTVSLLTSESSSLAITAMDKALDLVNGQRAELGAVQNRFESVIQNLQSSSENLAASRGRIMDADFAKETANLSRSQILQQVGTAMVAQANQIPQGVLSLLR